MNNLEHIHQEKKALFALDKNELNEITGGWIIFFAGIAVGYVVGEVIQGIYQAEKRGCI